MGQDAALCYSLRVIFLPACVSRRPCARERCRCTSPANLCCPAVVSQGGSTSVCQSWLRRRRMLASRSSCRLSRRQLRSSRLRRPVSPSTASPCRSPHTAPGRSFSLRVVLSAPWHVALAEKVMMLKKAKEDADEEIAAYKQERERLFQIFSKEVRLREPNANPHTHWSGVAPCFGAHVHALL